MTATEPVVVMVLGDNVTPVPDVILLTVPVGNEVQFALPLAVTPVE